MSAFKVASKERRFWICGLVLLAVALSLIAATGGKVSVLAESYDHVGRILFSIEYPAWALRDGVLRVASWTIGRGKLESQLKELQRENLALRLQLGLREERALLREGGGEARIVARYPGEWWRFVVIDKGSTDGVVRGMPALQNGRFLAGRVRYIESNSSVIELISSSTMLVPVVVDDTRDIGIIRGDDVGGVWLLYIPMERKLEAGMTISTAMAGEALPPGIPVGRVGEPGGAAEGYGSYRLYPYADLSQLRSVTLIDGTP
ncbi:rod shape-determining protein MreC [Acetomicrobium sp. S15 = DSM 107314]|uniref:rod shape-determining protein MreC n=1 Tax=Acetomicrobium sp. S15 = DSM 107314 TaxID=2529858 RepID=UPI0018E0F712|nr:rod shape-determining protein MreC [Acetomicrobium sp. S15 = DSM 107314]